MSDLVFIGKSKIHGNGLFAKTFIPMGTKIILIGDLSRFQKKQQWITKLGKLVNHQKKSNSIVLKEGNLYFLYALKDIPPKQEITSDYSTLSYPFIPDIRGYKELR